jgi:hypothetical protein
MCRGAIFLATAIAAVFAATAPRAEPPPTPVSTPLVDLPLETSGPITVAPVWTEMPTAAQMSNFYPRFAWVLQLTGRVTLTCSATTVGTLEQCSVENEHPAGLGFADAALLLAPYFHLKAKVVDGAPVGGVPTRFTIVFRMPPPEYANSVDDRPAPTAQALELARQLIALLDGSLAPAERAQRAVDQLRASMNSADQEEHWETPEAQAAIEAYRQAWEAAYPTLMEGSARALAKTYSEAELADILAFYRSPSGQAWIARQKEVAKAEGAVSTETYKAVYADTRQRLCQKIAC